MARLAYANSFKLHTFYSSLLDYKEPIWNRDVDRNPSYPLLELLSRYTGQSIDTLQAMTLHSYAGVLFESMSPGNVKWILPVGIYHRDRRRAGMQFCPVCLQATPRPYYKKQWRLAFYVVCEVHECLMHERCPQCRFPIAFHRNGMGRKGPLRIDAMYACHGCGFDLRLTPAKYIDWLDPASLARLVAICGLETLAIGQLTLPWPLPFFTGLRCLVNIVFGRYGKKIRAAISSQLRTKLDHMPLGSGYEFLDISQRSQIMLIVSWLLEDWPERFMMIGANRMIAPSLARADRENLPFWIQYAFDQI